MLAHRRVSQEMSACTILCLPQTAMGRARLAAKVVALIRSRSARIARPSPECFGLGVTIPIRGCTCSVVSQGKNCSKSARLTSRGDSLGRGGGS